MTTYIEFNSPVNTDEAEQKIRRAFPDNIRKIVVGVDHKNFVGMGNADLVQNDGNGGMPIRKTMAEMIMAGAQAMSQKMECKRCGRIWHAHGMQSRDGIFLKEGTDKCMECHSVGVKMFE